MKFTVKNLILLLVFVLCGASLLRFLNISTISYNNSPVSISLPPPIHEHQSSIRRSISRDANSDLTYKETKFLSELLSHSVPCNLLIFGQKRHYSTISSLNAGGFTTFLENRPEKTDTFRSSNNTRVHNVKYNTMASEAYQLLKDARANPHCRPNPDQLLRCNLALKNLPPEVYETMWDVVVVDGPSGDAPDSPGRMGPIYTAAVLARRRNRTRVIVHDVDRMIEKWFSWEFLCEENLVSAKGRFWHFQVLRVTNATIFCTTT
ncbi:Protein of unknown function (DUF579 [Striga hermonthica]|uniref:Polysaccharide biosynthesis domain-containing protein n=1 Tax=Striga hermonthica TaxID=68872 RepID=A0A9N7R0M5_STRHE|nr:Protein of unknown function (DUF579 [Striga hermonthica]